MAFEFDKTFVADFIDEYKNHPALWNVKSVISKNKHLRNKGIEALVLKCKERIPEADNSFVKKKINNLRTAYKRELAKVRASKRTGSSADEIYVPTRALHGPYFFGPDRTS
ncbi:unnamed protein product [Macrosiphum euphorbiae]|uniref:MADF domain-containing protein n=1 Tax=Macrosiphum euphorbiae TaxID=13131 RepID=A0AAV0XHC4_9HEMI|nr:unnamed protein product [Macrosiphum euphorbiae]